MPYQYKTISFVLFLSLSVVLITTTCGPSNENNVTIIPSQIRSKPTPQTNRLAKCVDARQPTIPPNQASLFPQINQSDHITGSKKPIVTILVYSDFQCVTCASLAKTLSSLIQKYPTDLRLVFRPFPLESIHDKAALAAQAAEAAGLQNKFWVMHDLLFDKQNDWLLLSESEFKQWLLNQASMNGIDATLFEKDTNSPLLKDSVQKYWEDGKKIQLPGVPVILINDKIMKWQYNLLEQLEIYIKLELLANKQIGV